MGSSVRKTTQRIKKLLKETIESNPGTDCKEVIPQIAEQTLRSKKTKNYFGDKEFAVLAGGGFACFKRVNAVGITNFIQEYDIKVDKLTVIEAQKIIECILDNIEKENGEIDSMIILSAFQRAMTRMLLQELSEPAQFLTLFCEIFITMVIREDASEALISAFNTASSDDLDTNISEFAHNYVKNKFSDLIKQCDKGKIEIEELINKLQEKLGKGKE